MFVLLVLWQNLTISFIFASFYGQSVKVYIKSIFLAFKWKDEEGEEKNRTSAEKTVWVKVKMSFTHVVHSKKDRMSTHKCWKFATTFKIFNIVKQKENKYTWNTNFWDRFAQILMSHLYGRNLWRNQIIGLFFSSVEFSPFFSLQSITLN